MKFKTASLFLVAISLWNIAFADQHVRGYYRKNGTYVQPYTRTSPNNSVYDNYSTKGNTNPYTGKEGTVNPYNNDYNNGHNSQNNNYNPYQR
jgi:hypothetical protein